MNKAVESGYKNVLEGMLFLFTMIVVFNMLIEFFVTLGWTSLPLGTEFVHEFLVLASLLAVLNWISGKFFGMVLFH